MTDSTEPITIQLSVDWGAGPLWVKVGHEAADNYLADEITEVVPLSDELRAAIETWDERYQQRLNKDDPAASRKFTPDEETEFTAEGIRLAQRIKSEVPIQISVEYVDTHGKQWPITDNHDSQGSDHRHNN
ncbi:MAG TPA: hypothetical protein VF444_06565 [Pseudonocardiaceae bacterium]